jgi:hypothetical protein
VGGALIDRQLARYDYRDAYQVVVMAPPEAVYDAVMQLDFLRLPLIRALFAIRELPARTWRRLTSPPAMPAASRARLSELLDVGAFILLGERPGREIVLGSVGRPWRPDYGPIHVAPSSFAAFADPGFAKIAWSWMVKPIGSGQTLLVVEWRTQLTDEDARSHFGRYWAMVSRGVRLLARVALGRIKIDCERLIMRPQASLDAG